MSGKVFRPILLSLGITSFMVEEVDKQHLDSKIEFLATMPSVSSHEPSFGSEQYSKEKEDAGHTCDCPSDGSIHRIGSSKN